MDNAYALLMQIAMAALGAALFVCLFRAFRGPAVADRVIAGFKNSLMAFIITIALILFLSLLLKEGYLIDIALIYAMLSFLAVVLLCRISIGVYREKKEKEGKKDA